MTILNGKAVLVSCEMGCDELFMRFRLELQFCKPGSRAACAPLFDNITRKEGLTSLPGDTIYVT